MVFNVKEDTITEYLDKLKSTVASSERNILENLADILVYSVDPRVDTGTMVESAFNENNWFFYKVEYMSMLEVMCTGKDNPYRWTEFSDESNPNDRSRWRDYAYFQETTIDPVADSSDARKPHFIRDALTIEYSEMIDKTQGYLNELIKLKKV